MAEMAAVEFGVERCLYQKSFLCSSILRTISKLKYNDRFCMNDSVSSGFPCTCIRLISLPSSQPKSVRHIPLLPTNVTGVIPTLPTPSRNFIIALSASHDPNLRISPPKDCLRLKNYISFYSCPPPLSFAAHSSSQPRDDRHRPCLP